MCKDLELFDYVKYVGSDPCWEDEIREGIILGIDNHCVLGVPFLVVKDKKRVDELIEISEKEGFEFFEVLEGMDDTTEAQEFLESLGLKLPEFDYFSEEDLENVYFGAFDALDIMLEELRKLIEKEEDEMKVENKYLNSKIESSNGNTFTVGDLVEDGSGFYGMITFIESDDNCPVQAVSVDAIKKTGFDLKDFLYKIHENVSVEMSEEEAVLSVSRYFRDLGVQFRDYDYFNQEELISVEGNSLSDDIQHVKEEPEKPVVYLACPLSTEGDVMFANKVAQLLRDAGLNVYSPIEDESINDKSNDPDPEDIFVNDYVGIEKADYVFLVETGREQVGTHVELGIVLEKIISGKKNRVYAKEDFSIYSGKEVDATFLQGERYEYITDGVWYHLISEQGDIESFTEGEMNNFFEFEKVPDLFVYVNNKRLQEPQVKYGKPSASMNQLALGGIMEFGTLLEANNLEDAVEEFAEYVSLLETKVKDL